MTSAFRAVDDRIGHSIGGDLRVSHHSHAVHASQATSWSWDSGTLISACLSPPQTTHTRSGPQHILYLQVCPAVLLLATQPQAFNILFLVAFIQHVDSTHCSFLACLQMHALPQTTPHTRASSKPIHSIPVCLYPQQQQEGALTAHALMWTYAMDPHICLFAFCMYVYLCKHVSICIYQNVNHCKASAHTKQTATVQTYNR
jgi:hypothetical protein